MPIIEQIPIREKVAALLRKAIYTGEYKANSELSVLEISAELNVSRTPVREALQLLETEGLVSLPMNKCATVRNIDEKFIKDQYEFRALMESHAAFMATKNGMDTKALEGEALRLLEGGTQEEYIGYNQRLHFSIWEAADNQVLYRNAVRCWNMPSLGKTVPSLKDRKLSTQKHLDILRAIASGDAEAARQLMWYHLIESGEHVSHEYVVSHQ